MVSGALAPADLLYRFGAALLIGIMVGLQRQQAHSGDGDSQLVAGVRTYALLGLLGATAAAVADQLALPLAFVAIVLLAGSMLVAAYIQSSRRGDVGLTSEIAALMTLLCGALAAWGAVVPATALGVVTTVLLSAKLELHAFARRLTRSDLVAALKLAVISVVVLPVLPDRVVGPPPFDVLNPFKIWLLVVFISGISFLGYILFQVIGARRGIGLTGLLGGLVSSTAVTLSFTQRSRVESAYSTAYALAITAAWTVMFIRVLLVIGAVNLRLLLVVWLPLAVSAGLGLLAAGLLLRRSTGDNQAAVVLANPFELGPAVSFGVIFSLILLGTRLAQTWLGTAGLYLASALAAIADVDAIVLSMAELSGTADGLDLTTAARAVIVATLANSLVKGGIVLVGAAGPLRRAMTPILAVMVAGLCGTLALTR